MAKDADPIETDGKKPWAAALRYGAVGMEMGIAVLLGYGAGWWLDQKFGTKPILTIVMLLLGIAAGFSALYRIAKEVAQQETDDDK
ncbi:MAG: AtpZ/AtpI family protein [Pseudomonadota bacterium]